VFLAKFFSLQLTFRGLLSVALHQHQAITNINKTFHSAADFPQENPEVAIEANRC
jgi:hypothetical protein